MAQNNNAAQMANEESYYVRSAYNPDIMLLYSMPPLPGGIRDNWMFGKPFSKEPAQPIAVTMQPENEGGELVPFFGNPPLVTDAFLQALRDAGVDNIVSYDVEIRSKDGHIAHRGYKAINIVGIVKIAGSGTIFTGESRLIDANMEGVAQDPNARPNLLMFRMAEKVSASVVHAKVKALLESRKFPSLEFTRLSDFVGI